MKNKKTISLLLLLSVVFLISCRSVELSGTVIEMEVSNNYDSADPFINEKLIYLSDDTDSVNLNVSFQMKGESGILEIADNETEQVFWSKTWDGDVEKTKLNVSLDAFETDKEYIIRFTGTKIENAKIKITCDNNLVKEKERPGKSDKK